MCFVHGGYLDSAQVVLFCKYYGVYVFVCGMLERPGQESSRQNPDCCKMNGDLQDNLVLPCLWCGKEEPGDAGGRARCLLRCQAQPGASMTRTLLVALGSPLRTEPVIQSVVELTFNPRPQETEVGRYP